MSKINLYGTEYEVYEKETEVRIPRGSLISSPARVFLLQEADRKTAFVVFLGAGGEAYGLPVKAARLGDDLAEHLLAQSIVVEAGKK